LEICLQTNTTDKVIGKLPDLGEVLALARLEFLCRDIEGVHVADAQITLATDGLVFDDTSKVFHTDFELDIAHGHSRRRHLGIERGVD